MLQKRSTPIWVILQIYSSFQEKKAPPPFYVLIKAFLQNMGLLPAHDRRLRLNPISWQVCKMQDIEISFLCASVWIFLMPLHKEEANALLGLWQEWQNSYFAFLIHYSYLPRRIWTSFLVIENGFRDFVRSNELCDAAQKKVVCAILNASVKKVNPYMVFPTPKPSPFSIFDQSAFRF